MKKIGLDMIIAGLGATAAVIGGSYLGDSIQSGDFSFNGFDSIKSEGGKIGVAIGAGITGYAATKMVNDEHDSSLLRKLGYRTAHTIAGGSLALTGAAVATHILGSDEVFNERMLQDIGEPNFTGDIERDLLQIDRQSRSTLGRIEILNYQPEITALGAGIGITAYNLIANYAARNIKIIQ